MVGEDRVGLLVKPPDFSPLLSLDGERCPNGESPDRSAGSCGLGNAWVYRRRVGWLHRRLWEIRNRKVVKVPGIAVLCLETG